MDAHVLVPLKAVDPKSRLGGALEPGARAELMDELLEHVAGEIRAAGLPLTLVTGRAVTGYDVWPDPGLPWNEALAAAAREVVDEPIVAFVSADLPRLRGEEVVALIEAVPAEGIAIGRARDG